MSSTGAAWIARNEDLAPHLERLGSEPRIAVDTESNSMYAYHERICVVQLSVPGLDLLIDAHTVDLAPIGRLLADPAIEKVFHAADYDILCFKRACGFSFANLFDTGIAARLLAWPQSGLVAILAARFGHHTNKRFQRYDWGQRPLSADAIAYAVDDTRYLLELRDLQWVELCARELDDEFLHACVRQCRVEPRPKAFDPDAVWRVKGSKALDDPGRAVLKALFCWRDALASQIDRPVVRVVGDAALVELARTRPVEASAIARIPGFSKGLIDRHGDALLKIVEEYQNAEAPRPPRDLASRVPRSVMTRFDRLRAWRRDTAAERGIEADLVLSKQALWAIAERNPRSLEDLESLDAVDPWECARYGAALIACLDSKSCQLHIE